MAVSCKIEGKGKGSELVTRIPLEDPKPSSSGKTLVVASTHGNISTGVQVGGKEVKLGLNAYISAK